MAPRHTCLLCLAHKVSRICDKATTKSAHFWDVNLTACINWHEDTIRCNIQLCSIDGCIKHAYVHSQPHSEDTLGTQHLQLLRQTSACKNCHDVWRSIKVFGNVRAL